MISNSSLAAFSATTTTPPTQRLQPQPRLERAPTHPVAAVSTASKTTIPNQRPSVTPPRGTLLNLSV